MVGRRYPVYIYIYIYKDDEMTEMWVYFSFMKSLLDPETSYSYELTREPHRICFACAEEREATLSLLISMTQGIGIFR